MVLRAADVLVNRWGRTDMAFALMGFGDTLDDLRALSTELGLDDVVTFTGRRTWTRSAATCRRPRWACHPIRPPASTTPRP